MPSFACTTGPPTNAGAPVPQLSCGGYKATKSQSAPSWRQQGGSVPADNCRLISRDTRCCRSQNCVTRGSLIRAFTIRLGLDQSMGRIGSQTTSTCM